MVASGAPYGREKPLPSYFVPVDSLTRGCPVLPGEPTRVCPSAARGNAPELRGPGGGDDLPTGRADFQSLHVVSYASHIQKTHF